MGFPAIHWFKLLLLGFSYEAGPFLKFSRFEKNHVIRQSPMDVYIVPFRSLSFLHWVKGLALIDFLAAV